MQTVVVKPQYNLSLTLYDRGELNMIDFTHWNHVNMPSWVSKIGYNEFWERFSNAFLVLCINLPLPANISEKKASVYINRFITKGIDERFTTTYSWCIQSDGTQDVVKIMMTSLDRLTLDYEPNEEEYFLKNGSHTYTYKKHDFLKTSKWRFQQDNNRGFFTYSNIDKQWAKLWNDITE